MSKIDLAIIPAKKQSLRLPNKNTREIDGRQLWEYSYAYAYNEGLECIVSTDNEEIIEFCKSTNTHYFEEKVDDSNMLNCIKQVIDHVGLDNLNNVAVLQPTSPLRKPNMLKEAIAILEEGKAKTVITTAAVKVIGVLDGEFQFATRAQDCKRWFDWHDGNILVAKASDIIKYNSLFTDEKPYCIKNEFPCNLQIDSEHEFAVVRTIIEANLFPELSAFWQ